MRAFNGHKVKQVRKRGSGGVKRQLLLTITLASFVLLTVALFAGSAEAHFGQYGGNPCTDCHTPEAGGTFWVAVDGVEESDLTVSSVAGQQLEIDYYYTGVRGTNDDAQNPMFQVPDTTWTVTTGTDNSPALPAWSTTWNLVNASNGGVLTPFSAPNDFGYTVNYDTTLFDAGNSNVALDDGTEPDGTADFHGVDFRVTVPIGASGQYTIFLRGIGHTANPRTSKWVELTVDVSGGATPPSNVSGPTPSATDTGTHVDSPFHLNAVFDDNGSVLSSCEYDLGLGGGWVAGSATGSGASSNCDADPTCNDGDSMTIQMRATNTGGTTTTGSISRTCDTAAPTTTDNAPAGWQSADVNVTLTPTDGGSGVASTEWCVDTTNTCTPNTDGDSFGTGTSVNVTCGAGSVCNQYARYRSIDNLNYTETTQSTGLIQIDKSAPATINDLATGAPTPNSIPLTWSNPADSGSGNASFEVRYRVGTTFVEGDWAGASLATGEPTPPTTGMTVGSLSSSTNYAFAIKTTDNVGNVSIISNAATASTQAGDSSPSLSISAPNGESVTVGDPFNITYTLSDDGTATVDFYYDVDNTGADGTAITECQDRIEGSNLTCAWDTTGEQGTWYVYGIADDTVNPTVDAYSLGTLTVNPPNQPPGDISALSYSQEEQVSTNSIPQGRYSSETSVVFTATITDPESDDVRLEIEIVDAVSGTFTDSPSTSWCSSDGLVTSGTPATATCGLPDGKYKWQGRGVDSNSNAGNWVEY